MWYRVVQCGMEWWGEVYSGGVWYRVVGCGIEW